MSSPTAFNYPFGDVLATSGSILDMVLINTAIQLHYRSDLHAYSYSVASVADHMPLARTTVVDSLSFVTDTASTITLAQSGAGVWQTGFGSTLYEYVYVDGTLMMSSPVDVSVSFSVTPGKHSINVYMNSQSQTGLYAGGAVTAYAEGLGTIDVDIVSPKAVPEPLTMITLGAGALALVRRRRRTSVRRGP